MIDKNAIPTAADWGDYEADLDTDYTFRRFNQKNFVETAAIFAHWIGEPSYELSYMPIIPFQYYMTAFSHYVHSAIVQGAFDFENHYDLTYYFFALITSCGRNLTSSCPSGARFRPRSTPFLYTPPHGLTMKPYLKNMVKVTLPKPMPNSTPSY